MWLKWPTKAQIENYGAPNPGTCYFVGMKFFFWFWFTSLGLWRVSKALIVVE